MGIVAAIALIVCGALAASGLIIAKKPNAKELLDKIMPYQGIIGLVVCLWGLVTVIHALSIIGHVSDYSSAYGKYMELPKEFRAMAGSAAFSVSGTAYWIWWLTYLFTGVVELALGFLLGFPLIAKYALSKSDSAMAKGEAIRAKLVGIQTPLGLVGIAVAIWSFIAFFAMRP